MKRSRLRRKRKLVDNEGPLRDVDIPHSLLSHPLRSGQFQGF